MQFGSDERSAGKDLQPLLTSTSRVRLTSS